MSQLQFSLRMLKRDWRSGALRIIFFSLVIAVASMSSVNFFVDRVDQSLRLNANELLAADLVIKSDKVIRTEFISLAEPFNLKQAHTKLFRSMALAGNNNILAEVKAVDQGYPLRGKLKTTQTLYGQEQVVKTIPPTGQVWVEAELLVRLKLQLGETLTLGKKQFTVSAILAYEPDRGSGMFNIAPRILLNMQDLAATGLVQPGSRIEYQLLLAGQPDNVRKFKSQANQLLQRGEQLIEVTDARQEVRDALSRAQQFLGLSALVSLILAAVAMGMAVRTFVQRHLDHCAVMRCLGAGQKFVLRVYFLEMLWLSLIAGVIGCIAGYLAHAFLVNIIGQLVEVNLPASSFMPVLYGMSTSIVLMLVFVVPTLLQLKDVPTLRVIRRELGALKPTTLTAVFSGVVMIAMLLVWQANDIKLGLYMFAGLFASCLMLALVAWLFLLGLKQLRSKVGVSWRFGLANISRRSKASITQIIAFGVGIMALMLMSFVTSDLLRQWKERLPPDTPNRFVINIQKSQVDAINQFFKQEKVAAPQMFPMIKGRLQKINGQPVVATDYEMGRARHLVEREFNLSWAEKLQEHNRVVQGQWWQTPAEHGQDNYRNNNQNNLISLEEGLAKTLGIHLNDQLEFNIAGEQFDLRVANIRAVEWDSFQVNFFAIVAPEILKDYPASYITSFHLPKQQQSVLNNLVQKFPNLTVIDISSIMNKVRNIILRVTDAVQIVFLFTLMAGMVVLYATILSTYDERAKECAMLRTFGANQQQLLKGLMAEFVTLGVIAGLVAALTSTVLAYVLAEEILHIEYSFNLYIWLVGPIGGGIGVGLAGYFGVRAILQQPPIHILRSLRAV